MNHTERVAAELVAERQRHFEVEGWTNERDDEYALGEMARAAAAYALSSQAAIKGAGPPPCWPWEQRWWKPKYDRFDLIKSGSLILSELERVDRRDMIECPFPECEDGQQSTPYGYGDCPICHGKGVIRRG
jgi:hypothetical protein